MAFSRTSLVNYISENFGVPVEEIDDALPLFSSNILDSFNMVDLVAFVESETGVRFGVLDLTLDNLDTIARIEAYVAKKRSR